MKITTNDIIEITKDLVAIPSQGGLDRPEAVLEYLSKKCSALKLPHEILKHYSKPVGLSVPIINNPELPVYTLIAIVDTAPIGNVRDWNTLPFHPEIKDGWMYGRGTSDGKVGGAILLALAEHIKQSGKNFILYFDADEHTGKFFGARAFMKRYPNLTGGCLLYPGNDQLVIGGRGFYRATAKVRGTAAHSGSKDFNQDNAVLRACDFIKSLELNVSPKLFPLPPKLSVTAIHGGKYFSVVPDSVNINIDIRTTYDFSETDAEKLLQDAASKFGGKIYIVEFQRFPAYALDENSHIRKAFEKSLKESRFDIPSRVVGLSNTGNLMSGYGIDMTSGFGVTYKNAHAANECIELASIEPVVGVYKKLVDNI